MAQERGAGQVGADKKEKDKNDLGLGDGIAKAISEAVGKAVGKGLRDSREGGSDAVSAAQAALVPVNMQQDARLARQETLATGAARHAAATKAEADAAAAAARAQTQFGVTDLTAGLANPIAGGLKAGAKLVGREVAADRARKGVFDREGLEEGGTPRTLTERDGGNEVAGAAPKAPVVPEPVEPPKPPPTVDEFVAKARKKKGYLSTQLSAVNGGTTQGKTLLGS